jgi:hypothetical protein
MKGDLLFRVFKYSYSQMMLHNLQDSQSIYDLRVALPVKLKE